LWSTSSPSAARRGVGASLLRRVEADARREGKGSLFVRAARNAVPFYAAMGYRPGRTIAVALPGGASLPAVLARKRLAPAGPRRRAPR
jgi:GNAT superfamily N-acetyltransferase